jgi:hypothetical protein
LKRTQFDGDKLDDRLLLNNVYQIPQVSSAVTTVRRRRRRRKRIIDTLKNMTSQIICSQQTMDDVNPTSQNDLIVIDEEDRATKSDQTNTANMSNLLFSPDLSIVGSVQFSLSRFKMTRNMTMRRQYRLTQIPMTKTLMIRVQTPRKTTHSPMYSTDFPVEKNCWASTIHSH